MAVTGLKIQVSNYMTDTQKKPNINYNSVADFFYLIVDYPTSAIMASTKNYEAAQAMQLFSRRLIVRIFETHKPYIGDDFKETNFNDLTNHYTVIQNSQIRQVGNLDSAVATPEFIARRREIISRLTFHDSLLTKVELIMLAIGDSRLFQNYADTIGYELAKCNPDNNEYSFAVQAYGIASDCNAETAYNELKLQMDNLAHARMRSMGIYIKYRNKLNQADSDKDSQSSVLKDAMQELIRNSAI